MTSEAGKRKSKPTRRKSRQPVSPYENTYVDLRPNRRVRVRPVAPEFGHRFQLENVPSLSATPQPALVFQDVVELQLFVDRLHAAVRHHGVAAPRIPLRTLAARYRRDAGRSHRENDILIAHVLSAVALMIERKDEDALCQLQRTAAEYILDNSPNHDSWGVAAPRLRKQGAKPLGAEALLKRIKSTLAGYEDLKADAIERNARAVNPATQINGFDLLARQLMTATAAIYVHLAGAEEVEKAVPDIAAWLRRRSEKVKPRDLPPVDVAVEALTALGMARGRAHNTFKYLVVQERRAKERAKKRATLPHEPPASGEEPVDGSKQ